MQRPGAVVRSSISAPAAANAVPGLVVRCRDIAKTFGAGDAAIAALRGADLDLHPGEMLLLAGPSGGGKTTLLSIIGAMLERDGGECAVAGEDPQEMRPAERARFRGRRIGFVFQSFRLLAALSAVENVAVPMLIGGEPRVDAFARARRLLRAVGLENRAAARPHELSGGQQQRVAIARALARDPQLIICDEPTSNLDHQTGAEMIALLRQAGSGADRAILIATHDSRVLTLGDRVAWMEDGRIVRVTPPAAPELPQ